MAGTKGYTEGWHTLPWKQFERNVFRLQKRIYRAARRGDFKCVRNLQRLLLRSYSARCLAVRRVTQDNRGKRTPGVDGVAKLTPPQRMQMVDELRNLRHHPAPIRRVYIDKRNSTEKRPLGIPIMRDRALQALVTLALEPEWEARFEPNSYGFRSGRSCHDAIGAIYNHIRLKPKYVLDADIEKCFDKINHEALLDKLNSIPIVTRLVRGWLKAGIFEDGQVWPSETGAPQGGVISPVLANVALHGMETAISASTPTKRKAALIRYADDLVILHEDLQVILTLKSHLQEWLATMGLNLKESKTSVTHTLHDYNGNVGFDFLGFTIRQFHVGKYKSRRGFKTIITPSKAAQKRHLQEIAELIQAHRGAPQTALIVRLNRKVRGWANYYRACVAKKTFDRLDSQVFWKLWRWAKWRHPRKSGRWRHQRYWRRKRGRLDFSNDAIRLIKYADTKIQRHVKVRGDKSPFDGDWTYWATRLGRDPTKPQRVVKLLKYQRGRCPQCGLRFRATDIMEVHHIDHNRQNNAYANLQLLHGHCHDEVHR